MTYDIVHGVLETRRFIKLFSTSFFFTFFLAGVSSYESIKSIKYTINRVLVVIVFFFLVFIIVLWSFQYIKYDENKIEQYWFKSPITNRMYIERREPVFFDDIEYIKCYTNSNNDYWGIKLILRDKRILRIPNQNISKVSRALLLLQISESNNELRGQIEQEFGSIDLLKNVANNKKQPSSILELFLVIVFIWLLIVDLNVVYTYLFRKSFDKRSLFISKS